MDFVSRLRTFMTSQSITNSQFADTCGIPRPTLSQILAGRNKKISDELISKIHAAYPWINVMWLLFGEGPMMTGANMKTSEPQNDYMQHNNQLHGIENERGADAATNMENSIDFAAENFNDHQAPSSVAYNSYNPEHNLNTDDDYASNAGYNPDNSNYNASEVSTSSAGTPASQIIQDRSTPEISEMDTHSYRQDQSKTRTERKAESAGTDMHHLSDALRMVSADNANTQTQSATRRITNIVVFYDDNSFQSFLPSTLFND